MKYYALSTILILTMFLIYCSNNSDEQETQAVIIPVKTEISDMYSHSLKRSVPDRLCRIPRKHLRAQSLVQSRYRNPQ